MKLIAVVLIFFVINLLLDVYAVKQLQKLSNKFFLKTYYIIPVLGILMPITTILCYVCNLAEKRLLCFMWLIFVFIALFVPKLIYVAISSIGKLCTKKIKHLFNIIAVVLSVAIFSLFMYSAMITTRTPKVVSQVIEFDNLPQKFEGFKIIHISDFHLGSFSSKTDFVSSVITEINDVEPDVILFTGDLVNSLSIEAKRFKTELSRLDARHGVYSVLGNHDYGDYYKWGSSEQKSNNFESLKKLQQECGWKLLNNEHVILKQGNDSIAIIGVENWGDYPFPKYGDLDKAYNHLNDNIFKVLLSHNPVHWRNEVLKKSNIDLMLAGHTHAMQCVFEVLGNKWSPAKFRYNEWSGLYEENGQKLYVNSGIGYVGLPVRIGVNPEITLITLKRKQSL